MITTVRVLRWTLRGMAAFAAAYILIGVGGSTMGVDEAWRSTLTGVGLGLIVCALEHVALRRPLVLATALKSTAAAAGGILVTAGSVADASDLAEGSGYTLYGAALRVLVLLVDQQWQARSSVQRRTAAPKSD